MSKIVLFLSCRGCESRNVTLFDGNMRRGDTPSGYPFIQHWYQCRECNLTGCFNIVETPDGVQIA